ncbi:helix-turn-helix transcriptional regulator [Kaistia dalseonensis]|nr:helix-turn-helix transcriptional regulator [Kaistia dalseonensis]MCX5494908.1 helix-turn-helix transcriptional regulator [Kaistia dalseonensis]
MANKKQPNPIDIHVGSRVRLRRMMQSMSQEKLGESLGITFQQIQKYEKGTNRIGASRLQHIASVLQVPVSFFFEDAPGGPAESGFAESRPAAFVTDFLSSAEGLQLNKAFIRIKDPKVRRRVVDLVRSIAGEEVED